MYRIILHLIELTKVSFLDISLLFIKHVTLWVWLIVCNLNIQYQNWALCGRTSLACCFTEAYTWPDPVSIILSLCFALHWGGQMVSRCKWGCQNDSNNKMQHWLLYFVLNDFDRTSTHYAVFATNSYFLNTTNTSISTSVLKKSTTFHSQNCFVQSVVLFTDDCLWFFIARPQIIGWVYGSLFFLFAFVSASHISSLFSHLPLLLSCLLSAAVRPHQSSDRHSKEHRSLLAAEIL